MKNQFDLNIKEVIQYLLNYANGESVIVNDSDDLSTIEAINVITKLHLDYTISDWNINITECVGSILILGKAEKRSNKF